MDDQKAGADSHRGEKELPAGQGTASRPIVAPNQEGDYKVESEQPAEPAAKTVKAVSITAGT